MTPLWDDLGARARGLSGHFLTRAELERLNRVPDLVALAGALRSRGVLSAAVSEVPGPEDLELAIRRWSAAMLRILARWAGTRAAALPLVFADEDRRSLRAIFRGVVQRAPAERRLAGLIATPALPERALEALAGAKTPAAVAALLAVWRHPFAAAVTPACAPAHPDLFVIETALSRAAAAQATTAAARAHHRGLRNAVADAIDLDNGCTAVLLTTVGPDVVARDHFLPGGTRLSANAFAAASASGDPAAAAIRIAAAFAATPYAGTFAVGADPASLEDDVLRQRLQVMTRLVRRDPLGPLPLLCFALRLRAQVVDLQRIVWSIALGAPRSGIAATLTTVAA